MSVIETAKYLEKWFPSIGRDINGARASLNECPSVITHPTF
jgi:hypothetical protein